MEITISAGIVAWYAALVSTLAIGIDVMLYLRDRNNIVVECREYEVFGKDVEPYKKDTVYVTITVRNKGVYPVTIEKAGFFTKNIDKDMILTDSLQGPREINGGQNTSYLVEKDLIDDLTKISRAFAIDGAGRVYKSKRLNLNEA
jgi:hypothetical protein